VELHWPVGDQAIPSQSAVLSGPGQQRRQVDALVEAVAAEVTRLRGWLRCGMSEGVKKRQNRGHLTRFQQQETCERPRFFTLKIPGEAPPVFCCGHEWWGGFKHGLQLYWSGGAREW